VLCSQFSTADRKVRKRSRKVIVKSFCISQERRRKVTRSYVCLDLDTGLLIYQTGSLSHDFILLSQNIFVTQLSLGSGTRQCPTEAMQRMNESIKLNE
jgi:hypothetical protein